MRKVSTYLPLAKLRCQGSRLRWFLRGPQRISACSAFIASSTQRTQRYAEDRREDPLHIALVRFVRFPIFSVKFYVPFRNKLLRKIASIPRDLSAQMLLGYHLAQGLFETFKRSSPTCQRMEASTREQQVQLELEPPGPAPAPAPELRFRKQHKNTVTKLLRQQTTPKTTSATKSLS